jgi:NADH-quinone oxidoreductase subunit L
MAGPTPVSALIHAATMVTAGIFMITRLNYLFDLARSNYCHYWAVTSLVAALSHWFKLILKVLAYSTVSQLGLALGLGAYEVAVFHVITRFLQGLVVLRFGICYSCFARRTRHAQNGWIKKGNDNYIYYLSYLFISYFRNPFQDFLERRNIMVAFEHNKILWFIASLASLMTAFYMLLFTLSSKSSEVRQNKSHLHESPALITFPLIVLAILATLG